MGHWRRLLPGSLSRRHDIRTGWKALRLKFWVRLSCRLGSNPSYNRPLIMMVQNGGKSKRRHSVFWLSVRTKTILGCDYKAELISTLPALPSGADGERWATLNVVAFSASVSHCGDRGDPQAKSSSALF